MPLESARLPLLLAGPILRRVESDLICVWIATSKSCNASLLLFDGADVVASETSTDDLRAEWVSGVQPTLQAGAHLHVLALILDLKVPGGNAVRSNGLLQPNRPYSYDLNLFARDDPATRHTLRSMGLLEDPVPLGYDRGELPSFLTPPAERDKLVIVHGSCRELFAVPPVEDDPALDDNPFHPPTFFEGETPFDWPRPEPKPDAPAHTGDPDPFPADAYPMLPKRDGMLWVDALIDQRGSIPGTRFVSRPHQLFLTGDQIYADSMSAVVLPALNNVGRVLVGEEDLGNHPVENTTSPATLPFFPPAFRNGIAKRSAAFTMSGGSSHVFSFGEFIAHYLLTWSPSLWNDPGPPPRVNLDLWPDDFNPSALEMPEDWYRNFTFDEEIPANVDANTVNDSTKDKLSADCQTLREHLPAGVLPDNATLRDQVEWYFQQRRDWLTTKFWSKASFEWYTRRFRSGLPRVRRALANVPTYMLADDHEITDDWYFSRQWREGVFTRTLGVDVVRNGMMAYTLMQAWGNDPRRWSSGPERELLEAIQAFAAATTESRRQDFDRLHHLFGLPHRLPPSPPTFRPLVEFSYQFEGPCHRVLVIDGRTRRKFPHRTSQAGGIDYEGNDGLLPGGVHPTGLPGEESIGLFGNSPMAAALPAPPVNDGKLTIVVTGVPVLGPEGMELALVPVQRLARVLGSVDAEAWSYEPATYEALLAALSRYGSVVLLSGDIHLGFSAFADYWSAPSAGPVRTARFVQLVSSGFTKDWGDEYAPALRNHVLTHDVFESATTPTLPHAERVGWGTPLRETLAPPTTLGAVVTLRDGSVPHPFYRSRLKMRAPVVPTHGWPEGTIEAREPNWAWRAFMVRDERQERTDPPDLTHRWTPVVRPEDPLAPESLGFHARAARRMAYGRVFAINPNIGVVTFEEHGGDWQVRHVLAGELPPLADTGPTPVGLQPFIVHAVSLTPPLLETWTTIRPRIVDDGGWGADETDPVLGPLLKLVGAVWRGATGFGGGVWEALPPVIDDVTREALLTDAANRLSADFRRRVLRELGPFALKSDAEIDALPDASVVALLGRQVGQLEVSKEARAIVRPDLERALAYEASIDNPINNIDDILLLAASEWVNDRQRLVSLIAGLLSALRSPITKHVPVLGGVLEGLWDVWRNRTFAEDLGPSTPLALLFAVNRSVVFLLQLVREVVVNIIDNHSPRPNGALPIFTPELTLAGAGIALGAKASNKRLTFVSGWDLRERLIGPGTRLPIGTPDALARQTLSLLIHPGGRQRYTAPAQSLSATMVTPSGTEEHGSLFVSWAGGLQFEGDIGGGVRQRVETDGAGFVDIPWVDPRSAAAGSPGATLVMTFFRPTRFEMGPGIEVRLTPSVALALGIARDAGTPKPAFEVRFALNDTEDRIALVPDDGLLRQLLPSDGITLPVGASVAWSPDRGWRFTGLGETASEIDALRDPAADFDDPPAIAFSGTEVVTPINQRLGLVTLHERRLEVRPSGDQHGASLTASLSGTVSLNLKKFRIAISGLGIAGTLRIASEPESPEDAFDLSVDPTMPTGLGVSIDAEVVSGAGFLERLVAPDGRVTWRGGLALRFADGFDISAFGLVEVGGNRPYTLLIFLVVRFSPGFPLTLGLKLTAVGGLLALNRTMNVDALRDAALGTPGGLESVLFPERPGERLLELMPAVERFFPPAPGHQVVGLMVEIEWKSDTGTTFGFFRGALLAELENFQFGLYGTAQLGFPTLSQDHILRIRAGIEALYDHRAKLVRVSLTLTEALLFKRVRLTGGAALLIRWGDHDEFAFTLGGFHPSFRPFIPEGLREPPRLGATWKPNRFVDLSIQSYFAFTSTSLQFGFSAHVEIGASWGGLRADADFDFLVMTQPDTRFELDLSFRVTAFLFGCDLISAGLRGSMTGPGPWSIEGSIYWELCGVTLSKDFGPHEWGDSPGQLSSVQQEARQLLGDALADATNWSLRRSTGLAVRLRPGAEDAIDPHDQIDVRQRQLPLGIAVEVNDANTLADAGAWSLTTTGGLTKVADLTDVFPTRRYLRKPPKASPFRGGLASGARLGGTGWNVPQSLAVESDESTTEDTVLDSLPTLPPSEAPHVHLTLDDALLVASPTTAIERRWTRHAVALDAVSRRISEP